MEFPPETHIIGNGILKKNSKLVVAAPPKSYKSFMVNTMLVQLLTGGHLFNVHATHAKQTVKMFPIEPVERVLLLEQELGLEDNRDRFKPFWESLRHEERLKMESGLYFHSCDFQLRLDDKTGYERVGNIISSVQPQVVVMDPLIKFHRSDENDPTAMNIVMCNLSELQQQQGFSSVLIHHHNKSSDKQGLDMLRGGSSIAGDLDTCLQVTVHNRSAAIIKIDTILKRGKPVPSYMLQLDPSTLRMNFREWTAQSKEELKSTNFLT